MSGGKWGAEERRNVSRSRESWRTMSSRESRSTFRASASSLTAFIRRMNSLRRRKSASDT